MYIIPLVPGQNICDLQAVQLRGSVVGHRNLITNRLPIHIGGSVSGCIGHFLRQGKVRKLILFVRSLPGLFNLLKFCLYRIGIGSLFQVIFVYHMAGTCCHGRSGLHVRKGVRSGKYYAVLLGQCDRLRRIIDVGHTNFKDDLLSKLVHLFFVCFGHHLLRFHIICYGQRTVHNFDAVIAFRFHLPAFP